MAFDCIQLTLGPVALLTIDRPKALNALNRQVFVELEAAIGQVQAAGSRCLVITGQGAKAFVAGADIAELDAATPAEIAHMTRTGHRVFALLEGLACPVLAAVNGFALGGGLELALACDIIYAADHAKFGLPEVKLGLIPGFGGTERLARRIGLGNACAWTFTGDLIGAGEAHAAGLVSAVFPAASLLSEVQGVAQRIASRAPLAVAAAKHIIVEGRGADPSSRGAMERQQFSRLFTTADRAAGTAAFLAKREPDFKGN